MPFGQYCDGVADCPDASDEAKSDCSCEGWGLVSHAAASFRMCLPPEWCQTNMMNEAMLQCLAEMNNQETGQHNYGLNYKGEVIS